MVERTLPDFELKGPKPRTIGILIILLIIFIFLWGSFALVPAGHRGVVLWWGSVEKRVMGEGLNFKVPIAERVIKVDVRVQPHPFKEIDAASKEYQMVKLTGMMNFHIDPSYVNDLYQKVGLDFANNRFSPEYEKAIEAKQVAQQQVETQRQVLFQREIEAQQKVATAKGEAESILVVAQGQSKANDALSRSISPILVEYKGIEKWNGILPQFTGGAVPFIDLGKMGGGAGGAEGGKR